MLLPNEKPVFRWKALEYEHTPRSVDWFWGLGAIALVVAVTSVLMHNTLFAIFIVLAALTLALLSIREPRHIDHILTPRALIIGDRRIPYHELESFHIEEYTEKPHIVIITRNAITPRVTIPLAGHHPETVRTFLSEKIEEKYTPEGFSDIIASRLGF